MCEYCRQIPCNCKCPNAVTDYVLFCGECGEGIAGEEEYIMIGNVYYHKECAFELSGRDMLKELGINSTYYNI